jgi:hypothetical protein
MRSMAREGRLGKSSVADLPGLLRRIVSADVWRSFLGACGSRGDPRTRWSPKLLVLAWLIIGWEARPSLGERFEAAWKTLAALFPQRRRPGKTYAGLNQSSLGVRPSLARHFLARLRSRLQRGLRPLWDWQGWIVFAVDGSRIDVPRTRANERKLGRAGRKKTGPQFWLTTLIHLPSRVIWDWRQGTGTASERGHLREMLDSLPTGALVLADAGYVGFDLMSAMVRRGVDFVIRCGANVTLLIDRAEPLDLRRASTAQVALWPTGKRRKRPLMLRLITLQRGQQRIHLLTSVCEDCRLPRRLAARMYAARWGTELNFRALKQTLERRKLRARSPEIGAWELAGNVLALALLLAMAAWLQGVRVARAGIAELLRVIRTALERLRYGHSTRGVARAIRTAVCDDYERRRSKRARDWPHKKNEKPAGTPNLRRMTKRETAVITSFNVLRAARLA